MIEFISNLKQIHANEFVDFVLDNIINIKENYIKFFFQSYLQ